MATWPSVAVATKTSDKVDTKVTVRSRMLPTAVEATWSDGEYVRQAPKQFSIAFLGNMCIYKIPASYYNIDV